MGNYAAQVSYLHNPDVRDRFTLRECLSNDVHWVPARVIRDRIGMSGVRVRELAQLYPTMLVSSTMGYKLAANSTKGERLECVQSLITRGEKIISRARELASTL
jgi:hypothetical protein